MFSKLRLYASAQSIRVYNLGKEEDLYLDSGGIGVVIEASVLILAEEIALDPLPRPLPKEPNSGGGTTEVDSDGIAGFPSPKPRSHASVGIFQPVCSIYCPIQSLVQEMISDFIRIFRNTAAKNGSLGFDITHAYIAASGILQTVGKLMGHFFLSGGQSLTAKRMCWI
jgi:hypothetical protein